MHMEAHTPWQTTHSGSPSGSSHSPRLNGRVTLPSLPVLKPPLSYVDTFLFRCCHSFIVCSIDFVGTSPRDEVMSRSIVTQSLICRTQCHGSLQSSSTTRSVSGIVCDVNSGFRRGAKAGEDSERKYIDSLASISRCCQVYISRSGRPIKRHLLDLHPTHPDMYTPKPTHWQSPASSCVGHEGVWEHQRPKSQGALSACPGSLLSSLQPLLLSMASMTNPGLSSFSLAASSHWQRCPAWLTTCPSRCLHPFETHRSFFCSRLLGL